MFLSLCLGNNPIYILFTLLVLLPCLCQCFFFPISILFLLFPYCFSNLLIPPCFLMPAWAFWQSTCDLCSFHHYIFHLLPVFTVHLHRGISILLLLPYLWSCFGILHMSFPPWAPIHRHSWYKLLTPSFCCVQPLLTVYDLVHNLHLNDPDITNLCFVLLPHNNIINHTFNRPSCICHHLGFLLHKQSIADD